MSSTTAMNDISVPSFGSIVPQKTDGTIGPSDALTTAEMQSAREFVSKYFTNIGLPNLGISAWEQALNGIPIAEILLNARSSPEYKARYPAMDYLMKTGQGWNEGNYLSYEKVVRESLAANGIPVDTGFYEPSYIAKFIEGNVAPDEVKKRIEEAGQAAKIDAYGQAAKELYGVDQGHLTAYFLDPDVTQPIIEKRFGSIQAAGEAKRAGFGDLTQQEAEYLSQFGMSDAQLNQNFGNMANPSLATALPGEDAANAATRQNEIDAIGGSSAAQQRIRQRQEQLAGATKGDTGFTQSKEGSGIGSAQQPL